ncbi:hypothetical protein HEQ72_06220 [Haematospirillum sp. 15-248]|uniref:ABC transporter substrate-binding protein n=1 Tax=Haematospirillum sp. 15-248 TaxID=2723107 RepID=UPI00143ABAB3|nr:ABC transporter substrate-binding protein [Haematospirillum sp. 15-248]NKD87901.1 hypothetical protein [Haematospirillum sp. 15-248]
MIILRSTLLRFSAAVCFGLASAVLSFSAAAAEQRTVLMVLWRGVTAVEQSFRSKIEENGYSVTYTEILSKQDRAVLGEKIRALQEDIAGKKFDIVYCFGTTACQMTVQVVRGAVPVLFVNVFDPVGAGLVHSMKIPGGNVTGVTIGVPVNAQLDALSRLVPIKRLSLLYNARESNANLFADQVRGWAGPAGVEVLERRVAPGTDALERALVSISSGELSADALFIGTDSYLISQAADIHQAIGSRIPLFASGEDPVRKGWLATWAPLAEDIGRAAAEMALAVFKGQDASMLPIVLPKPHLIVSKAAADLHKATIPDGAVVLP